MKTQRYVAYTHDVCTLYKPSHNTKSSRLKPHSGAVSINNACREHIKDTMERSSASEKIKFFHGLVSQSPRRPKIRHVIGLEICPFRTLIRGGVSRLLAVIPWEQRRFQAKATCRSYHDGMSSRKLLVHRRNRTRRGASQIRSFVMRGISHDLQELQEVSLAGSVNLLQSPLLHVLRGRTQSLTLPRFLRVAPEVILTLVRCNFSAYLAELLPAFSRENH